MQIIHQFQDLKSAQEFFLSLGSKIKGGEVIEFKSDLGGGKTTLTRALVQGSESKDEVSSPSFTLCNLYKAKNFKIYHFDFYRLNNQPGIMVNELKELLVYPNVVIIEWGKTVEDILPKDRLKITIRPLELNSREITFNYPDKLNYLF